MKYLIMECHPSYAVALEDNGTFLKVANMHYVPGQRVSEVIPMQTPEKTTKTGYRWVRSLAAVAACLVLLLTSVFVMGRMPYASVYLTINPQVRIDVNRSDVVVGLEGVNQDGIDLIEGYTFKKKNLDLVMDDLVDIAIEKGYLHPGGEINLTLDATDETWVANHETALSDQLNTYLTDKITVEIHVERASGVEDPGDSDYETSDYGTTDYSQTVTVDSNKTDYDKDDDGQTDYGASDYAQSQTAPTEEAEKTDYHDIDDDDDDDDDDKDNDDSPYDDHEDEDD